MKNGKWKMENGDNKYDVRGTMYEAVPHQNHQPLTAYCLLLKALGGF